MIVYRKGDIMFFNCKACGCGFAEATSKTHLEAAGVWDENKQDYGTWMDCPECGESVLGFRDKDRKMNTFQPEVIREDGDEPDETD